ncbi:MAG TPA: LeuA family protein [Myxococcus sp.]|nr:LeuA family protein [Myxococcus sp.]
MSVPKGRRRAVKKPARAPRRPRQAELIHDWNATGAVPRPAHAVQVSDETLRDGVQSASVRDPSTEDRQELLTLMDRLGVGAASLGMPCTGERGFQQSLALARHVREAKLKLEPYCAGRTVVEDLAPIAEVAQRSGVPVVVHTFVGASAIRQWTEGWDVAFLRDATRKAIQFAVKQGLEVAFVTEDTIRSTPAHLEALFRTAVDAGASRLVLCDTVGHATPDGARALVQWTRKLLAGWDFPDVQLEWHGHNDRGLALPCALTALEAGCHRAHGCGLGVGERTGNAPLDLMLMNLSLLGWMEVDLGQLLPYVQGVSRALGVPIPRNYPLAGEDAFTTSTGVHAAAILKARARGDAWLEDLVYSSVPAAALGRKQAIEVGPMSGRANIRAWLEAQGIPETEALCRALLGAARASPHLLSDEELRAVCAREAAGGQGGSRARKGRNLGPVS